MSVKHSCQDPAPGTASGMEGALGERQPAVTTASHSQHSAVLLKQAVASVLASCGSVTDDHKLTVHSVSRV